MTIKADGWSKVLLIGDIGGRADVFKRVLSDCGVRDAVIPADRLIIQVGDVVTARYPNTAANETCVRIADELISANPENYLQLWGNHDLARLPGAAHRVQWRGDVHPNEVLERWWAQGSARFAAALRSSGANRWTVVSHAGVTEGYWRGLGCPPAPALVTMLNANVSGQHQTFVQPGALLTGDVNPAADCVWAEIDEEFYLPWMAAGRAPFDQVHGHASPWSWDRNSWRRNASDVIRVGTTVDQVNRRTATTSGSFSAISIDWGLDTSMPDGGWPVYQMPGGPFQLVV
jgi:hypothetical protein